LPSPGNLGVDERVWVVCRPELARHWTGQSLVKSKNSSRSQPALAAARFAGLMMDARHEANDGEAA